MDIRRTILWMIFSFSLLLLWNNWQIHNGKPSLFGATPPGNPDCRHQHRRLPTPAFRPPHPRLLRRLLLRVPTPPYRAARRSRPQRVEEVNIKTDVFNLTFDTHGSAAGQGGTAQVRGPRRRHRSPWYCSIILLRPVYLAQTGVIGAASGDGYPTHLTPFKLVSSQNDLTGDTLKVVFESEAGGVKVAQNLHAAQRPVRHSRRTRHLQRRNRSGQSSVCTCN